MSWTGKQHFLDASVAYKRAVLNCVYYLTKFGYTKEQVRTLPAWLCKLTQLRADGCAVRADHPAAQLLPL